MLMRLHRCVMAAVFVTMAGVASAQDTELLKYDIEMRSALQMNGTTFVLPPGEYRLEQYSHASPNLFLLKKKDMGGQYGEPVAILDAWQVPYYEGGLDTSGVKMVTDPEAGGMAMLRGWQIGNEYWRLRDVATLNDRYFTVRD